MSERLRASDLALLADETPQTPLHNATLEIFDPGDSGFDYDALPKKDPNSDRRSIKSLRVYSLPTEVEQFVRHNGSVPSSFKFVF